MSQDSQGVDNVNLVLLSLVQQYRISLIQNSQDLTLWSYNGITPEMFRNNNFVNKDGQKISFGRIRQNVGLVE
jgi:hypothetical protein